VRMLDPFHRTRKRTHPPTTPSRAPRRNIPYGFHHFPLTGAHPGFPVWLDINLSEQGAATWLAWLRDALLLDESTRGVAVGGVTYNADLGVFALVAVEFEFGSGGSIQVRERVDGDAERWRLCAV
jgi:hypothetical protein